MHTRRSSQPQAAPFQSGFTITVIINLFVHARSPVRVDYAKIFCKEYKTNQMKCLRYTIIALLVYLLVFSVRFFVFPTATLATGAVYEGHDLGVTPQSATRSEYGLSA